MKITVSSSLIDNSNEIVSHIDQFSLLFNKTKRILYSDIVKFYKSNNTNYLSDNKLNELKSSYQPLFRINSRHFNSIFDDLLGNIKSIKELNKSNIDDTKNKIKSLDKSLKSKNKILDNLIKKINKKEYVSNHLDKINLANLKAKIYHIKNKLSKANTKLDKLLLIEKTGNPHLCFGSKKLFRQQFLIGKPNNLTEFKSHQDWKKAWIESRNKTFLLIGSKDETAGNCNCQIEHIKNDIYQLKVNLYPKATKLKDQYVTFNIKVHNDKHKYLLNAVVNNLGKDKSQHQALTFRFYKDYKNNTYQIFIALDKSQQQPKIISYKFLGSVGIDINADHLSVSEIDSFGNLNKSFDIQLNLKDKTTEQSLDNIACAIKQIIAYAKDKSKPIVIENLNFNQKKKELKSGFNKKYNTMLSSFAYKKITELIKSRAFDSGVGIIEVNPSYTSKIGRFKYQNLYKLTTHQAAAFVIARRGLLSYDKKIKKITIKLDKETKEKIVVRESKLVTLINKEKTISTRRNKYYPFVLPVRNSQKQDGNYWKEIEQNYLKAKKHRIDLKRKKLILGKQGVDVSDLPRETTVVADSFEVNRDLNPDLLFMPF